MALKLVSLNIEGDKHLDLVLPFLKKEKPDVACLYEAYQADLPLLERALKAKSWFFPMLNITADNPLHFPTRGKFGLAVLSPQPLSSVSHQYYKGSADDLPNMGYQQDMESRPLVWFKIAKNQQNFTIATTHFNWVFPGEAHKQKHYLSKLLSLLKQLPEFVLAGDFNAPRGEATFNTLAKVYKDNIPSSVKSTLDPKIHRVGKEHLVVDGLFTTPKYQVKKIAVKSGVSDHKAIVAQIDKA